MTHKVHHLPRMGITAAMSMFGTTARALRFYEERGLIEAQRDRLNTRFYDATARGRLEWITRLRKADLSLPDIREVLDAEDPAERTACAARKLDARRDELRAKLATVEAILDDLGRTRPDAAGAEAPPPVRLRR